MNKKSKKIAVAAVAAICTLSIGAVALTACGGGKTDWTKYKYDDFNKITEAQWDSKTIAHQFVDSLEGHGTTPMGSWYCLVNLYDDGSMVYLQGFATADDPDSWIWGIKDYSVRWINYGYWEESDGSLKDADGEAIDAGNILMTYTHYWDNTFEDDAAKDVWKQTEVWKEGSSYTIKADSLQLWFMGQDNGGNEGTCSVELTENSTIKYSKWVDWFNAWKNKIPEPSAGGPGGGLPPASDDDRE